MVQKSWRSFSSGKRQSSCHKSMASSTLLSDGSVSPCFVIASKKRLSSFLGCDDFTLLSSLRLLRLLSPSPRLLLSHPRLFHLPFWPLPPLPPRPRIDFPGMVRVVQYEFDRSRRIQSGSHHCPCLSHMFLGDLKNSLSELKFT